MSRTSKWIRETRPKARRFTPFEKLFLVLTQPTGVFRSPGQTEASDKLEYIIIAMVCPSAGTMLP